jgi:1-acyl-sn-glycerol-3-phosphate acyltransferase
MGRADAVAVRDGGQPLDVRSEHPFEGPGLGLAQLRELGGDVGDGAEVLAELGSGCRRFSGRRVPGGRERSSQGGRVTFRDRELRGFDQRGFEGLGPVLGERDNRFLAAGGAQIAQRGGGQIVVGVWERGPTQIGECIGSSRSAPPTAGGRAGGTLDQETVGHESVEMAPDRGRRDVYPLGQRGRSQGAGLQNEAGHEVARATFVAPVTRSSEFHNTSMTYFRADMLEGTLGRRVMVTTVIGGMLRPVLYRAMELTVSPALRVVFRPDITGAEYVPRSGAVIIAGNHISFADEVFTPLAARRQVSYLAKAEYFTTPGARGRTTAAFMNAIGQVPVERGDMRAAAASVDLCVDLLREDRAFGIFPEGTRSPDARLYKFRTGVARIALRTGVPVVPVGLVGTHKVQPPGSRRWHRQPVGVHFGPALDFSGRAEDERSAKVLREVTELIRHAVQELSGQDYVDSYASTVKTIG